VKKGSLQRKLTLLLPLLVLILTVMILLREQVDEYVVIPLYYFFWLLGLVIRSVPQSVYWMILIGLGMLLALRALIRKSSRSSPVDPTVPRERSSRYQYWSRTFFLMRASVFSLEYSSYELRRLLLNILANQENLTFNEVEARIGDGSIPVPSAVHDLVIGRQVGSSLPPPNFIQRATYLFKERFLPHLLAVESSPLDAELNTILDYIENLLEVKS